MQEDNVIVLTARWKTKKVMTFYVVVLQRANNTIPTVTVQRFQQTYGF